MAGKTNTFESDILNLIFKATAIANIADNAASSPLTNLQFSLHKADPGEPADQTTSEVVVGSPDNYTNYARVAVQRVVTAATGFNASSAGSNVTLVADVVFGAGTASTSVTVTHTGIGTAASGAGKLLYSGALTPNIAVSNGITPRITASGTTIAED